MKVKNFYAYIDTGTEDVKKLDKKINKWLETIPNIVIEDKVVSLRNDHFIVTLFYKEGLTV